MMQLLFLMVPYIERMVAGMILSGAEPFLLQGGRHGVLLIHGFTGMPAELLLMGRFLQERGFTVLGVRLAGHGTTAEDLSHMVKSDWMDSVRDGYALLSACTDCVSAVGHSMGGLLALLLAAEKPLERVVTLAAPMAICKERGIDRLPPRGTCRGQYTPKARRRLKNVPSAVNRTYRKIPLMAVYELMDTIELAKSRLADVKAPLLIVHSHGDHTAEPASADYILEHAGSTEKRILWFRDSGHQLPLDADRDRVFEETADFLQGLA